MKEEQEYGKKRKREEAYKDAYDGVAFHRVDSTGRPGTPHRFFKESYKVEWTKQDVSCTMRVHQHANGLCIVSAEDLPISDEAKVVFQVSETPDMSAAQKRKRATKQLKGKGGDEAGFICPHTVLAQIDDHSLPCCVFGNVLELNPNASAALLKIDPLLKGYLAAVLPTGPFPPLART